MTTKSNDAPIALRQGLALIGLPSLILAILLACLISLFSFPVLAGVDAMQVMPAVIFTACMVAAPIPFALAAVITAQKRTEVALRESEDHCRHAVELSAQAPWTADPEGNILEAGPQWGRYTGFSRESAPGSGWTSVVLPDDLDGCLDSWKEALATGRRLDAEYRLRHKNMSYRWFRARAAWRRDDAGRIIRWYGSLEDVHDRRSAHEALQNSEEFTRSILDSTPDCVKVLDPDGTIRYMNLPGREIMEIECVKTVLGQPWPGFWPGDMQKRIDEGLEAARRGRSSQFSGYCPTATGTLKWWDVRLAPIFGESRKVNRVLAISRDMTETKMAQDRTEQEKSKTEEAARQLEAVLSSTTDCVMTLDRDLRITYVNRMAQDILPFGRRFIGEYVDTAFPELEVSSLLKRLQDAFEAQEPVHCEEYLAAFKVWLELHVYPQPDSISVFFSDVSKRHMSQEKLLYLAHHDTLTGLVNRNRIPWLS